MTPNCMLPLKKKTKKKGLTGTFFCVTQTAVSSPLQATDVSPPWLMALKAYSGKNKSIVKVKQLKPMIMREK